MKKILSFLCFVLILGAWSACTTDFDIADEWQEVTVVYGLLDASAPTQYVKVNKAFLSEDVSAIDMAAVADSVYHNQDISVILREIRKASGNVDKTIGLERVDAAEEDIYKEEGVFADSPYYLYKTDEPINQLEIDENEDNEKIYEIVVSVGDGQFVASETPIVSDFKISRPETGDFLNFTEFDYLVKWKPSPNAATYDLVVSMDYSEQRVNAAGEQITETKTFSKSMFSGFEDNDNQQGNSLEYKITQETFFNFILAGVPEPTEDVKQRDIINMDFFFSVSGEELQKYNDVSFAQLGISATQVQPEYTNIQGGLGIFSSRFFKTVENVELDILTTNEIACGELTGHLGFAVHPSETSYPFCN